MAMRVSRIIGFGLSMILMGSGAYGDGLIHTRATLDFGHFTQGPEFSQDRTQLSVSAEYRHGRLLGFGAIGLSQLDFSSGLSITDPSLTLGIAADLTPSILVGYQTRSVFPARFNLAFAQYLVDQSGLAFTYETYSFTDGAFLEAFGLHTFGPSTEVGFHISKMQSETNKSITAFIDYENDHFNLSTDLNHLTAENITKLQMVGGYNVTEDVEVLGLASARISHPPLYNSSEKYEIGFGARYQIADRTSLQGTFVRASNPGSRPYRSTLALSLKYEFGQSARLDRRLKNRFRDLDAAFGSYTPPL